MTKWFWAAVAAVLLGAAVASCADDKPVRRRKAEPFPDIVVEQGAGPDDDESPPEGAETGPEEAPGPTPDAARAEEAPPAAAGFDQAMGEAPVVLQDKADDEHGRLFNADLGQARAEATDDAPASFPPALSMTMHVLNIGQGAATLLEFPCGAMLFDTGGEDSPGFDGVAALQRELDAFFARRKDLRRTLDVLVITHPHIDHMRGMPMLFERYTVKRIIDDGVPGDDIVEVPEQALAAYLKKRGTKTQYLSLTNDMIDRRGYTSPVVDPFRCAKVDPEVRVLHGGFKTDPGWGKSGWGHPHFDNANNHSVATRIDFGKASILITGDLEETAIHGFLDKFDSTGLLDVDIYQVGHHGSDNGTTRPLMKAMTPQMAVISMGDPARKENWTAWQYGHPRRNIVDILQEGVSGRRHPTQVLPAGVKMRTFEGVRVDRAIYATGWDGTLRIDIHKNGTIQMRGAKVAAR